MGFAQPTALWLLGLLPFLFLLNFLRLRRTPVVVPSLLFWENTPADTRSNAFSRRFRRDRLLLLQLTMLFCAILALARPYLPTRGGVSDRAVFALDISASMGARDVSPSRFDAAKDALRDELSRVRDGSRVALIAAGRQPKLVVPFTSRTSEIRRALDDLNVTASSANLRAALRLAQAISGGTQSDIHLFTDAPLPGDFADDRPNRKGVALHRVGGEGENVSIRLLEVARDVAGQERFSARVVLRRDGSTAARARITLSVGGAVADVRVADLPPSGEETVYFTPVASSEEDIPIIASVETDAADALATDNRAYAVLPAQKTLRILSVGSPNRFLDALLSLNLNVRHRRVLPEAYLESDDIDLTIFHGFAPENLPKRDVLLIAPEKSMLSDGKGTRFFAERVGEASGRATEWERLHPLTRYADFGELTLARFQRWRPAPDVQTLVSAGNAPLLMLRESKESRVALMAFDALNLAVTDFAVRPASVIFLSNLAEWAREGVRRVPVSVPAGEPISVKTRDGALFTVKTPDGAEIPTRETFARTDTAGIYEVFEDTRLIGRFAVNVDRSESSTLGRGDESEKAAETSSRVHEMGRREVWQWLAGVCLLLLVAEWGFYHRAFPRLSSKWENEISS